MDDETFVKQVQEITQEMDKNIDSIKLYMKGFKKTDPIKYARCLEFLQAQGYIKASKRRK